METVRIILAVGGVAILAFAWPALCRERQRRVQREHQRRVQHERQWEGAGIDVSGMARRIESLRHDYLAEVHARPFRARFHTSLLAAARQTISRVSFFTRRHTDDEHHNTSA